MIQLLLLKPLKSVDMVTREVLTMEISAVAKKMQMQRLRAGTWQLVSMDLGQTTAAVKDQEDN